jgi:hypothetical protein
VDLEAATVRLFALKLIGQKLAGAALALVLVAAMFWLLDSYPAFVLLIAPFLVWGIDRFYR